LKRSRALVALLPALLYVPSAYAYDLELEFSEAALNRLVARLGAPSDGGSHEPTMLVDLGYQECFFFGYLDCPRPVRGGVEAVPFDGRIPLVRCRKPGGGIVVSPGGEPTVWQWWVTEGTFSVKAGELLFRAVVRYQVGERRYREERTVPAQIKLDTSSQKLQVSVSSFKVPIQLTGSGRPPIEVDVGRLMSFAIPVSPPNVTVRLLDGTPKTLTGRAAGAFVDYLPGKVRVRIDAAFN
jgi:hypothetical protein